MRKYCKYCLLLLPLIFTGCLTSSSNMPQSNVKENIKENTVKEITVTKEMKDEIGSSLLKVSRNIESYWFDYIELMKQRKGIEANLPKDVVPDGMGAKISIQYTGHVLALMKSLSEQAGYTVKSNMKASLTKIINVQYKDTRIIDIMNSIVIESGIIVEINTLDKEVKLTPDD